MIKIQLIKIYLVLLCVISTVPLLSQDLSDSKFTTTKTEIDIEYTPYTSSGRDTNASRISNTVVDGHQRRRVDVESNKNTSKNASNSQQEVSTVIRKTITPLKVITETTTTTTTTTTTKANVNNPPKIDTVGVNINYIEKVEPKTLPISFFLQKQN